MTGSPEVPRRFYRPRSTATRSKRLIHSDYRNERRMVTRISPVVFATILLTPARVGPPPQRVWQADVLVQALEITEPKRGGPLGAHVVVAIQSNDEARAVHLEVLLPIGVGVLRMPAECHLSRSPVTSLNARVTCDLGDMPGRGSRDVSITTTGRVANGPLRVAVFAVSDTPDPLPANNFAEKVLP